MNYQSRCTKRSTNNLLFRTKIPKILEDCIKSLLKQDKSFQIPTDSTADSSLASVQSSNENHEATSSTSINFETNDDIEKSDPVEDNQDVKAKYPQVFANNITKRIQESIKNQIELAKQRPLPVHETEKSQTIPTPSTNPVSTGSGLTQKTPSLTREEIRRNIAQKELESKAILEHLEELIPVAKVCILTKARSLIQIIEGRK
jgi:hypothetical protein